MSKQGWHWGRVASFLLALLLCLQVLLARPDSLVRAEQAVTAVAHWTLPLPKPPRDVLTGDMDGDGQREIVVVCHDGYLALLEGDGTVVWQAQHSEEVSAACLADLDGDARFDLLIGSPRGVTAMRGDGSEMWFYRTAYPVDTLSAADVDNDGNAEVIVATTYEHVYELDDDGTTIWHYWPQRRGFGGTVRGLAVADFDDDGRQEVAVAFDFPGYKDMAPAGHIRLLDDDGKEMWYRKLKSPVMAIAAVDPDGWGKFLIAAGTEAGEFMVLFGDSTMRWYHELGSPVLCLLSGDVDDDQRDEVVAVAERRLLALDDDGSLLWERSSPGPVVDAALGDFEGIVGRPVAVLSLQTGLQRSIVELIDIRGGSAESYLMPAAGSLVCLSDLNMDGWGELLFSSGEAVQLLSRARGVAHSRVGWRYKAQGEITALDAADVDGDGRFEILVGSQDSNLCVLKDDGSLSWRYHAHGAVRTVGTGDVDGDGQQEVIVSYNNFDRPGGPPGSGLSILKGDGRVLWHYETDNWVWNVCAADLDGDGSDELIAGTGSNRVLAISADGQAMWSHLTAGSIMSLYAADLDGDGRAEVVAGSEDNRAYLLSGDGSLRWYYDTGRDVSAVCGADLDGDGLGEVVIASEQGMLYALRLDGTILWEYDLHDIPFALYAGEFHDGGRAYVTAATSGGGLYVLNGDGVLIWLYSVQGGLRSACAGDVDGDRRSEIVAGSAEGMLYVVTYGGRLERRHELGEGISALYVGDIDDDGRAEILAGARDGQLWMYEHTPNRPPLAANPGVTRAEAGYVYSVSINDPDGDSVEVTLEVLDPFSGAWRSAGTKHALEPGVLYWFVDPFPLLASGRTAAYCFAYSDGLNTGTLGPVFGPRVPGLPWYTYAELAAIIGLLVFAYRAWYRSPTRHARLLYARLASSPQDVLAAMRNLAVSGADPAEALIRLSKRARAVGDRTVASLAEGYLLFSSRPATGLQIIASTLAHSTASAGPEQSWVAALVQVYQLLADLLGANSMARVTVLRPRMQRVLRLLEERVADDGAARVTLANARDALGQFLRVASLMRSSERIEAAEGKLDYLAQAAEVLAALEDMQGGPEGQVMAQIAANWQRVVAAVREEWRGRAQLRCRLRTRRIVATGEALLVLEVQNRGRSPALRTTVELAADGNYKVLGVPVVLGTLQPGHTREAELRLAPPAEDRFRVEFLLRYDDREARGKSQLFADMVEVLAPSEFQLVPNPYVPGRPLRPASPLFYGREDVFDFISKNARGLLQRNILILIGQRRTGKTSMLLQLPLRLSEHYVPVYLDCQSLGMTPGLPALLYDVAMTITDALAERGMHVPVPELAAFQEQTARAFEHGFLRQVQDALADRTLLLVLDEFEELEMRVRAGHLEPTLFSYLRHLMQHSRKVAFVFVGTHRLEEMTADYWSVLFNIALYRHIGYLDESSARHLITEPVRPFNMVYDDLALNRMLQVTTGHPYFLQLLCYSLVNAHNRSKRSYTTIDDVDQALEEILTLGEAHFSFLWETSAERERATLVALTRLLPRLGQASWPQLGVTASDVALLLAEHGLTVDPRQVSVALRSLAAREILQEVPGDVERYVFKVGLVALWIERCKSLSKVIEELS